MDGIAATRALRAALPGVRVLIVTTFGRPGFVRQAMGAGASGFVVKDTPARQLANAVRRVHAGLRVVDGDLALESLSTGESPLTERETDVLRAARSGDGGRAGPGPAPVRGHGAQPLVGGHGRDRRAHAGRGRPHRGRERVAAALVTTDARVKPHGFIRHDEACSLTGCS